MRARSWMAALALIGVTSILIGRGFSAQGPNTAQTSPPKNSSEAGPQTKARETVGFPVCPHPSQPGDRRLGSGRMLGRGETGQRRMQVQGARTPARLVRGTNRAGAEGRRDPQPDHTCSVAITVREPGQTSKTIYRGFRMANRPASAAKSATASIPTFTCYLSSRLAGVDDARTRK